MSMISELVDRMRVESKSMGKYGVDYMATLLMQAADTIAMLSEKAKASADRPQGEWYQIEDHKVMGEGYLWHCSLCDHRVYQDSSADYPTENFCPNCGADMRKGADDE